MRRVVTHNEAETRALARTIAATLRPGALVALSGELGTGKTALVRGICEHFGCLGQVSSPTFTIVNEYLGAVGIAHCDLYRLETVADLLETGLLDIITGERIVLIEWAERAASALPFPRLEILCDYGDAETERVYVIHEADAQPASLLAAQDRMEAAR
jgi:tRNA threonylcarbamoyladenosine biosynthesis protein TsaE